MKTTNRKGVIPLFAIGVIFLITVFALFSKHKPLLSPALNALAEEEKPVAGTCCQRKGETCEVGSFSYEDMYYKSSGPCQGD